MRLLRNLLVLTVCLLNVFTGYSTIGKPAPGRYGLPASTGTDYAVKVAGHTLDSLIRTQVLAPQKHTVKLMQPLRVRTEKTMDFYLLLFLCLLLGLIRLADPRYFQILWQAFANPAMSSRQLKDKLQSASLPNIMMNLFFAISVAAYIFYVVRIFTPKSSASIPPSLLIVMLIAGMGIIYLAKYAVIRFSGWAFRVEGITEHYLFNVFLINKIIAIALLPFVIVLAFSDPQWAQPALIISFILVIILFINRYVRSWQVFGSFFQYSKFHFFTYLCASELLPLAVLMKLLVRGLLY